MAAVGLVADKSTKEKFPPEEKVGPRLLAETLQRGMFTRISGDVYNFAPCYLTQEQQIDRMVQILGESIDAVAK